MKVIVTGFGSFLDNENNPTKKVLDMLPEEINNKIIYPIELPVVFDECFSVLKPHIDKIQPDYIVMLGLAAGRRAITPERVAVNMKDAKGPDNKGYQPIDEKIIENGKTAYFSTLPLRKIETKLNEMNIPVSISNSAGLYVCNNIMYDVLNYIEENNLHCKAGFIHVPCAKEYNTKENMFSLPQKEIYQAILNVIDFVL